ncbi:Zn-dependent exopeptidase [Fomitiporia mediterranea MF3/22]|uniref:Zn-dependent exopeptidase n=1 Tax=Fomitiporia mediterranea (strain MF3/22) TaxID=694068 RepID=UPI0004408DAB|nr:Zn-dependent exopeptidase [Fomitiporia mediterranea MF3/22]EJD00920.1 Zn-dependent exopeptidase [Fomitiporia mediterranea MF3/22]
MVVVLDAIESEKFDFDVVDEVDIEVDHPLLDSQDEQELPRTRRFPPLSRRGRRILTLTVVTMALILTVVCISLAGRKKNKKELELLSSLVSDTGKENQGLGFLNAMLNTERTEKLFLSIPSTSSAIHASHKYATHPHIAGSPEDLEDAKSILELFQTQFAISVPGEEPIYPAGSSKSRKATLDIARLKAPQAWIDVYYPIMNLPLDHSLSILDEDGSVSWTADLEEDGDHGDRDAERYRDAVPVFHGFSKDGEVEGEVIFAEYGRKEDYDALEAAGANLTGKIVITRYGEIFRGLKVKGAQERGAAGVIIYSDPRDDGAVTVENGYKPYPAGPARNPTSVQRGSVQFLSIYPGDPTTPGYPAYENATRVEGSNKPSIPSLPLSWQNAQRLLEEIDSPTTNRQITGKLSARKVKLVNHVDYKVTPIWNTMAVIPGHIKDEVVLIGNHRDAWVLGGADPTSGTVSLHEIIRGFGTLLRAGWKPLRTVMFASWDAEEYGLVGSTEWGEDFEKWIKRHVVAYLNTDVSSAGSRLNVAGSPSLAPLIAQTAKDLPHPTKKGRTLWDALEDQGPYQGPMDPDFEVQYVAGQEAKSALKTGVPPLGSGSDFTVFLQRIGIASSDQGFGGTPYDAPYHYHSIYDSEKWQEVYADPGFHRHVAIAKNLGLLTLRIANAIALPLNTTQYSLELDDYLDAVEKIAPAQVPKPDFSALRKSIRNLQQASLALDEEKSEAEIELRKLLEEMRKNSENGIECTKPKYSRLWETIRSFVGYMFGFPPPPKHDSDEREKEYEDEVDEWLGTRDAYERESNRTMTVVLDRRGHRHARRPPPPPESIAKKLLGDTPLDKFVEAVKRVRRVNRKLSSFERGFISEGGIKDREWYKHLGVAPGKWLGYGATTFPALTEALTIEQNASLARYEADRLQKLIDRLASRIAV